LHVNSNVPKIVIVGCYTFRMGKITIDDRHAGEYRTFLEARIAECEKEIKKLREALVALDRELVPVKVAEPTPVTAGPSVVEPARRVPLATKSERPKRKAGRPKLPGLPKRPEGSPPARLNFPPVRAVTLAPPIEK
jgi:hypothetical protein